MKFMVKTLLLSFIALTNTLSFCEGDFHKHVPSLCHSAATALQKTYVPVENIRNDIQKLGSIHEEISIDEVMNAINQNWITPKDGLEIAFNKKRVDIAESIIGHMPTQTQEQKEDRLNAIKATHMIFSKLETAKDIQVLFEKFLDNEAVAASGLSSNLVKEIQNSPLANNIQEIARIFVQSRNSYELREVIRRTAVHSSSFNITTKSICYDVFRALRHYNDDAVNQRALEPLKHPEEVAAATQNNLLEDIIFNEIETPKTIKHAYFILKTLHQNTTLDLPRLINNAARQNKKALMNLLLDYANGKISAFKTCVYITKASIPRPVKNTIGTVIRAIDKHPILIAPIAAFGIYRMLGPSNSLFTKIAKGYTH